MSNYAELNDDNIVVNVIVADAEFVASQTEKTYVLCNQGGIGYTYNGTNFVAPYVEPVPPPVIEP